MTHMNSTNAADTNACIDRGDKIHDDGIESRTKMCVACTIIPSIKAQGC